MRLKNDGGRSLTPAKHRYTNFLRHYLFSAVVYFNSESDPDLFTITAAGRTQPLRYSESLPRLHGRCALHQQVRCLPIAGVVPISYAAAAVMALFPGLSTPPHPG